jgi:hypothetical protein
MAGIAERVSIKGSTENGKKAYRNKYSKESTRSESNVYFRSPKGAYATVFETTE